MNKFKVGDIVKIDGMVPIVGNRIGEIVKIYTMYNCLGISHYGAIIKLDSLNDFSVALENLSVPTNLEFFTYYNRVQRAYLDKTSYTPLLPRIIDVIYHEPATIVKWSDGSKTVVKCGENDIYDPEKGLAMCIAKKALGNNGNYYELFKKWLPEEPEEGEKCRLGEVNSLSMNDDGITFNVNLDPKTWGVKTIEHLNDIFNPGSFMFKIVDPEEKSKDEKSST